MALPFVGVDGEGGQITDDMGFSHHEYTMLRIGDRYITNPGPYESLRFLAEQPKRQIHVAYFFDYDVSMMLRKLPEHLLRVLVSGQEIKWEGFGIAYRSRKELTIRHAGRITQVSDVGTFFQTRFVNALEQWNIGTPSQREAIGSGKDQRATFGELTGDTIAYNELECRLLVDLMEKFRRTCEIIGYLPRKWQGPGQLAKAMFRKHGIPQTRDLPEPPPGVWEMAQAAYYGGRFETSAVGPVRGPIEGWDINSAYPYACTLLPCLLHSRWIPSRDYGYGFGVFKTSFRHSRDRTWYTLPVRCRDGSIRFPQSGAGWYWSPELRSADSAGATLTIHHGWQLVPDCDCTPFDFMHRLYSIRKGIGKTEAGYALKLAMNSAYGVLAQSIGAAPYANPVWAGLITAITRARLNDALAESPYDVYMLATDGLFAKAGALSLVESDALGGWDRTEYPDMFIVQPGVYFAGDKRPKTRGVPLTAIQRDEALLRAAFDGTPDAAHPIELRQFIGLRLGLARDAAHTIGEWMPVTKHVSYDWQTKRRPNTTRRGVEAIRTVPYVGDPEIWSVPYTKFIGGNLIRDLDRLEFVDTPDWAETLSEVL